MFRDVSLSIARVILVTSVFSLVTSELTEKLPPPCDNNIYCYGPMLHSVQMASLFPDSKTFVDMKLKHSPDTTWRMFNELLNQTENRPSRSEIEQFVNETFDEAGSEFEDWTPSDWVETPRFVGKIKDKNFQEWASQLNALWKFLGRKMKDDVRLHQEQYSIIYVPHPVIVPGGRFREFYYWDSYWIVRGLILSEMFHTVKGMLGNFISIVERYGLIPNGGRIYYAMRSQPPLLIPMVKSYFDATNDLQFLNESIAVLEKEFQFWMTNRTTKVEKDGKFYTLCQYKEFSSGPRPESYREDVNSAQIFRSEAEREAHYSELKSGAESGWDFSSRWFVLNGTNKGNLTNLKARSIIPVDLNAILYWNADLLSQFYNMLGQGNKSMHYSNVAKEWLDSVTKVLWHDEVGVWLDYDISNDLKRDYFYPSNLSPLWTGCYNQSDREYYVSRVMKYLEKTQIMVNLGGIPTTLEHSGEQWDYPNAWPPLQYIMIMGLDSTQDKWAQDLAYDMTERWVRANYKAFNETHAMYEKYDATVPGGHGGGGEYEVQLGFGWTNGVIMEFLDKFSDRLSLEDKFVDLPAPQVGARGTATQAFSTPAQIFTGLLAITVTLAAGIIGTVIYKRRHQVYGSDRGQLCPKLCSGYMELKDLAFD